MFILFKKTMISGTEYELNDRISLTQVDDEIVLLNLANGAYYGLNHIGANLIRAIEAHTPLERAVKQISEQYHMDYSVVDRDLNQLINQLLEQRLIVSNTAPK